MTHPTIASFILEAVLVQDTLKDFLCLTIYQDGC